MLLQLKLVTRTYARRSLASLLRPSLYLLLVCCVFAPFAIWHLSSRPALLTWPSQQPHQLTALQRLQLQKSLNSNLSHSTTTAAHLASTQHSRQNAREGTGPDVLATPDQVATAQTYLLHNILQPKNRRKVHGSKYIIDPEPYDMRQQYKKVKAYLDSAAFAAKQAARKASGERGIIINTGGRHLLPSTIITLKILREVLNCTLPVELAWHTPSEMDAATLAALQHLWGPVRGLDLSQVVWPSHQRPLSDILQATGPAAVGTQHQVEGIEAGHYAAGLQTAVGLPADSNAPGSPGAGASGSQPQQASVEGADRASEAAGLPAERAAAKQQGFLFKVLSLTASSFASALLLDADNLPLVDPSGSWDHATYQLYGNLLWPDFWPPATSAEAYSLAFDIVGLDDKVAGELLAAGKGRALSNRGTESGQLLIDLVRHGDVAEWALWINSFGDTIYRTLWGDKDTYALAFAVTGKAHEFNQLQVPPAGAFSWQHDSLLVKATQTHMDGWQLAGMVHYNALGQPAFLHRTMNKMGLQEHPWLIDLLTEPLPDRWLQYFLSQDSLGPTVGVPVTYAAPAAAFTLINVTLDPSIYKECPVDTFTTYWALRQKAVPLGSITALDVACRSHLTHTLAALAPRYAAAQLLLHPELMAVAAYAEHNHQGAPTAAAAAAVASSTQHQPQEMEDAPVVACALPEQVSGTPGSSTADVIWASYDALRWLQHNAHVFPILGAAVG